MGKCSLVLLMGGWIMIIPRSLVLGQSAALAQVSMCQQLPARQALSNMLRASLELWRKSATLGEPVARLHRMGEVLTTLRLFGKQVKPMSSQTQQSLATVRKRGA